MSFINQNTVTVGNPTRVSDINTLISNVTYLNSQLSNTTGSQVGLSAVVPNYSFELDSNADTVPDGWTFTPYAGGSGAIDATTSSDGLNSFKIVIPGGGGNGGGYLENNDYLPCSNLQDFYLQWKYKTSVTTTTNQVEIRFFDKDQSFISSTVIQSASSGQSTSWALNYGKVLAANVPSGARFLRVRLTGGSTGSAAGNTWYDAVQFFKPVHYGQVTFYSTAGTSTWTAPENCTQVTAEMVSAGGGGASLGGFGYRGGGSGAYNKILYSVIPGASYTVVVGAGGVATFPLGTSGGTSTFNGSGPTGGAGGGFNTGGTGGSPVGKNYSTVLAAVSGNSTTNTTGGSTVVTGFTPIDGTRGGGGNWNTNGTQGCVILYY